MKNKELLSATSSTSWLLVFTLLFGLLLTSLTINAQSINQKETFNSAVINDCTIKEFTAKVVNNKIYFRFLVVENRDNTNYTLEASTNGDDYSPILQKEGFKSPNGTPLLYCYSLDLHDFSDNTYRIRRVTPDGVSFSNSIEFNDIDNLSLTAQKN